MSGRLTLAIPSDIREVSVGQLIELQQNPELNDMEAISILSGVSLTEISNVTKFADLQVFGKIIFHLSEQITRLHEFQKLPKKITLELPTGSKTINVIKNLSVEPAGAFFAAREIIAEEINEHIKKFGAEDWQSTFTPSLTGCCQVLAHYFYCAATGKMYNEYEAEGFVNEIKKMRVTEALPIARYFFRCYPTLLKPKTGYLSRLRQHWRKRQGSALLKRLNISTL